MPKGNSDDPFCTDGIDREGNRDAGWGPNDAGHIDAKSNRRGIRSENGLTSDPTPLDRPTVASDARAKRSSSDETYPWGDNLYGGPNRRQE